MLCRTDAICFNLHLSIQYIQIITLVIVSNSKYCRSNVLSCTRLCTAIGIDPGTCQDAIIKVYPNPGTGKFKLEMSGNSIGKRSPYISTTCWANSLQSMARTRQHRIPGSVARRYIYSEDQVGGRGTRRTDHYSMTRLRSLHAKSDLFVLPFCTFYFRSQFS